MAIEEDSLYATFDIFNYDHNVFFDQVIKQIYNNIQRVLTTVNLRFFFLTKEEEITKDSISTRLKLNIWRFL